MAPNTSKRVDWSPEKRGKPVTLREEKYNHKEIMNRLGGRATKSGIKKLYILDQQNQLQELKESLRKSMVKAESDGITKKPMQQERTGRGHHPGLQLETGSSCVLLGSVEQALLEIYDLAVDDDEPRGFQDIKSAFADVLEGLDKKTFENEVNEWSRRDTKGQEILVTPMEEGPMGHVLSCSIAFHMWNKLLAVYEKKSEVNVHLLQQKFFNCKHESEEVAVFYIKNRGNSQPAKANGLLIEEERIGAVDVKTVPALAINIRFHSKVQIKCLNCGIVDSGATEHLCCDKKFFVEYEELKYKREITIGEGCTIAAVGEGKIRLKAFNGETWIQIDLNKVLYVPDLKKENDVADIELSVDNNLKLWHGKFAHQNFKQLKKILKKHNIKYETDDNEFCEACIEGKRHREPFGESTSKIEDVCEMVRADLCRPMETSSIGGSKYFLLVKKHYSHYRFIYFLKRKTEVKEKLIEFIEQAERETARKIKHLRTDNETEFINKEDESLLKKLGICHQLTVAYTPEQNGAIEREMKTTVKSARTLLKVKDLNESFWAEAENTAVYVINRTGTSTVSNKTPYEVYYSDKNDVFCVRDVIFHPENKLAQRKEETNKNQVLSKKTNQFNVEENDTEEQNREEEKKHQDQNSEDESVLNKEKQNVEMDKENDESRADNDYTLGEEKKKCLRNRETLNKPQRLDDYETCDVGIAELDKPLTFEETMNCENRTKF
ncbi:hypothetical protein ILUMI_12687 [Ignelater luminosus]|uniref:Integrase catalytic domain-containing protein n=1 Tax=Ignelater luminosus TaxID=2038154 RepID=A0A8K0CY01_IGNLU|nr:hypothetical protein ILUMI_12687 [Ignelater luminosus]